MSKNKLSVLLVTSIFFLSGLAFAADGIRYGGSSTLAETVLAGGASKAFTAKTGVKLTVVDSIGTGKSVKSLLTEDRYNVVGAGRTLSAEEKKGGLFGTTVGYDGIAIFVNKNNPVKSLTKAQLKDIFTGKIKNWKDVGGKGVPLTPVIEPIAAKRGSMGTLQELILDSAPFGAGLKEIELDRDLLVETAKNEGTISYGSFGLLDFIDPGVKAGIKAIAVDGIEPSDANISSGSYLLSRPMLLLSKGLPKDDVKKFVDFMLSPEGQTFVEKYMAKVKK